MCSTCGLDPSVLANEAFLSSQSINKKHASHAVLYVESSVCLCPLLVSTTHMYIIISLCPYFPFNTFLSSTTVSLFSLVLTPSGHSDSRTTTCIIKFQKLRATIYILIGGSRSAGLTKVTIITYQPQIFAWCMFCCGIFLQMKPSENNMM